MDIVNLKDDLKHFENETLPQIEERVQRLERLLIADLQAIVDRLDNATITITIKLQDKHAK